MARITLWFLLTREFFLCHALLIACLYFIRQLRDNLWGMEEKHVHLYQSVSTSFWVIPSIVDFHHDIGPGDNFHTRLIFWFNIQNTDNSVIWIPSVLLNGGFFGFFHAPYFSIGPICWPGRHLCLDPGNFLPGHTPLDFWFPS